MKQNKMTQLEQRKRYSETHIWNNELKKKQTKGDEVKHSIGSVITWEENNILWNSKVVTREAEEPPYWDSK